MNIIYLNHYAGSPRLGMEYRPYFLAREWVRAGHKVHMLAASYSHVRAQQPELDPALAARGAATREAIDGIDYRWYETPAYQGNGLGRVRNIWMFLKRVWKDAPALVAELKPDVVIASSTYPMDIWVARRIARLAGAKLVHEVHDLWPLSPVEVSGMSKRHPFILLCQWAENTACRDADVVVSMLPKVHEHMASHGLDLKKLAIVPNGIEPARDGLQDEPLRGDVSETIAAAHAAGRIVVGYTGSHGLPNALDTLLDAAAMLRNSPFEFVLVGDGHEKARLARRVAQDNLQRVHLHAPVPKAQIPTLLRQIDIAYIGWQRVPIYRFGIAPNKLMDYMMAGCVVLHAVTAGNDPVADAGCGMTVTPDDPHAVAGGLQQLAALPYEQRQAMSERGRRYVQAHHTWPVLAQRFAEACGFAVPVQDGAPAQVR